MEEGKGKARWKMVRRAVLGERENEQGKKISRKGGNNSFQLLPILEAESESESESDVRVCYSLPLSRSLFIHQRKDNNSSAINLSDFENCNKFDIDNTGLVCPWPSEEVLAYYCFSHPHLFSSKTVIELGAGYGLAAFVLAAVSHASQVFISDGNPLLLPYIQRSIHANSPAFGTTIVKPLLLHWDQPDFTPFSHHFDFIIASDCTFFKESHKSLVRTVKLLLKDSATSEAIFFSPRRGNSLDKFLKEITESGLHYCISEKYDERVWNRHQELMKGDQSWINYEVDHCYPLLLRVSR